MPKVKVNRLMTSREGVNNRELQLQAWCEALQVIDNSVYKVCLVTRAFAVISHKRWPSQSYRG